MYYLNLRIVNRLPQVQPLLLRNEVQPSHGMWMIKINIYKRQDCSHSVMQKLEKWKGVVKTQLYSQMKLDGSSKFPHAHINRLMSTTVISGILNCAPFLVRINPKFRRSYSLHMNPQQIWTQIFKDYFYCLLNTVKILLY